MILSSFGTYAPGVILPGQRHSGLWLRSAMCVNRQRRCLLAVSRVRLDV